MKVPLTQSQSKKTYLADTSVLPAAGKYELHASVRGKNRDGEEERAESEELEYLFTPREGHVVELVKKEPHTEEHQPEHTEHHEEVPEEEEKGPHPLEYLAILIVAAIQGTIGFLMLKKVQTGQKVSSKTEDSELQSDPELDKQVQALRDQAAETELSLEDPRFSEVKGASSEAIESPASEQSAESEESPEQEEEADPEVQQDVEGDQQAEAEDQDANPEESDTEGEQESEDTEKEEAKE